MVLEPETGVELREYADVEIEARVLALVLTMTELEEATELKLLVEARLSSLLKPVARLVVDAELEPTDTETLIIEVPMLVEPNVITEVTTVEELKL